MITPRTAAIAAILAMGIAFAGTRIGAQQKDVAKEQKGEDHHARIEELTRLASPHWSDEYLRNLQAEETPEQSIYLSAVMLTRMEREQGDVSKIEQYLEDLAKRSPSQPLKSAVRRLIVDIDLERKDYKGAERQLKLIIDENLAQF